MAGSDFPRPCIIGYGSSPSRCGPDRLARRWSDEGSPRFRRVPFVRDGVSDHGRATAPRLTVPHMLPSTTLTASASAGLLLSRLNSSPHTIVVYASPCSLPCMTQHSLPGGRYPLPGPDFHRLDHASFAWRTSVSVWQASCLSAFASCDRSRHIIGHEQDTPRSPTRHEPARQTHCRPFRW